MTIESTKLEKGTLIKVAGRMESEHTQQFDNECNAQIAAGATTLILDLSDFYYISSVGLRSFMFLAKAMKPNSGVLILCGLKGLPLQVFETTRLLPLFKTYDTVEAALATL